MNTNFQVFSWKTSGNIFTENIRDTRNLETTFYVTDRKQQTDFLWYRESGIRINVGLQNIDIIPVYEDVDHEGDNEYMMGRSIEERANFEEILQKHCRYFKDNESHLTLRRFKWGQK